MEKRTKRLLEQQLGLGVCLNRRKSVAEKRDEDSKE
jgi:hypothetical protein